MHTNAIELKALARRRSIRIAFAVGLLGCAPLAFPQANQTDSEDEIFELSPFEVTGKDDVGYRATSTLAGTRIRTDLKDVGSAISVYTEEFLKDIGATDNGTLLQYTTNAEVGGTQGTYAGVGNGTDPDEAASLLSPSTNNRVRGLSAAENTRDYFVTDIPWDSYNVNRIDIQRGSNSILFGLGKPAGIINASLADAAFENDGKVQLRFGSYGSLRTNFSLNKVLVEDVLSVRVSALMDDQKYNQDAAFEDDERLYVAMRYEPKLFANDSMKTTFKLKYEDGTIDANRPRTVAPYDSVTPFFNPAAVSSSNPYGGVGKAILDNPFDAWADAINGATKNPWISGGPLNAQQPFWIFDGSTGAVLDTRAGIYNTGGRNNNGTTRTISEGLIGRRYAAPYTGTNSLSGVAKDLGLENSGYGQYRSMTITDPSVFNFYNTLIDGNTKSEWEEWDALNLEFSQTFFDDRLGVQVFKDRQNYDRGGETMLGWRPTIQMDILAHLDDGSANPNVGRPYVATTAGGGEGSSHITDRDYTRAALFGELRATDFVDSDSFLAKLLGKHRFNAVTSKEDFKYEDRSWQANANAQSFDGYWSQGAGGSGATTSFSDRPPVGIIYLGDSIAGRASSAGANIPGIQAGQIGINTTPVKIFDTIWNAPSTVGFSDPWTVPASLAAAYGDAPDGGWTQASNPDNYLGWTTIQNNLVQNYDRGSNPDLLRTAKKAQRETKSIAATWQGYWWNDSVVTTLGWRKDEIQSHEVSANRVVVERSTLDLGSDYAFAAYTPAEQQTAESISGGVVVHLNKLLSDDKLPINIAVSYNKGSNFEVGNIRNDLLGNAIANPSGTTEDWGVLLSTKDGRYSMRAVKYESKVDQASSTLQSATSLGSFITTGLTWRNVFLYELGGYDWASRDQRSYRNHFSNPYPIGGGNEYEVADGSPEELALADSIIGAWNQIQSELTDSGFLAAWGISNQLIPLNELTNKSTYQANKAAWAVSDISKVSNYTYTAPANFAVTSDTVSKGYEFEMTANPTDNLRVSFNASKTEAMNNNVGGDLINEFIAYLDTKLTGPAGDIPRWGGAGNAVYNSMYAPWRANYVAMKLSEGTNVPELRKWRYNVVANYSFTDGTFKGAGIGGSYRWQDKAGIGYPLVPQGELFGFDISNPNFGPSEDAIDLWASYGRKLSDKIDWKIQLNVRNAFAGRDLIPISLQPDNQTVAAARIAPMQEWFLTNTFEF